MRRLETALQRYAWGKSGSDSMVAQLKKSEDSDFEVDEGETYAELWMGTHPNGPSRVMRDGHEGSDELHGLYSSMEGPGMFLIELLETHPHYLGDQESVGDLPFMFKVLSINKALSIQAHPDKKLAERLYATRPDLYKDDNHKPEMAVALSDFEGLCGFRPFREIAVYHLEIYPELRAMVGAEATAKAFDCTSGVREDEEEALRLLFRAFVTANTNVVTVQVRAMMRQVAAVASAAAAARHPSPNSPKTCARDEFDAFVSKEPTGNNSTHGKRGSIPDTLSWAKLEAEHDSASPGRRTGFQTMLKYFDGPSWNVVEHRGRRVVRTFHGSFSSTYRRAHLTGRSGEERLFSIGGSVTFLSRSARGNPARGLRLAAVEAGAALSLKEVSAIAPTRPGNQAARSKRFRTAPATTVGVPPTGSKPVGWSSSKLAFPDVSGRRRESEDFALRALILRLAAEYPGDIGIMMPLLLNYLRMGEGESFFMAANEPHAYLKGDILEVMARSDNVVRVALTPKHRDVPLLCEILTYHMGAPPIVTPVAVDDYCSRYSPPIRDFEMLDIEVPYGQEYATPPVSVAALAIVMAGTGSACDGNGRQRLCRGVSVFVPANTPVVYSNTRIDTVAVAGGEALWVCLARSNLCHSEGGEECCS
ncbi:unnamed protein product [Scytosiphon promiscuus]